MKILRHPSVLHRTGIGLAVLCAVALNCYGQGGDKGLRGMADALFEKGEYAEAYPMYSQLVSLSPQDHDLNYRFGACTLYGGDAKSKAIGYLKFAVEGPATANLAWYFLGRAYQLDYRFDDAIGAYQHFRGTADKKLLARFPVDAMEQQCRNGKFLLNNLKDIEVLNKVEVPSSDFFRFYDLSDIGGKIVVTPGELLSNMDRKNGGAFLTYLPTAGGSIYFSSYGKDGKTGRDIYRSTLLPTGAYSTPVKLAGYINTDQDEAFAVMAPDGKTFYFCSKGHNSMGGYDVFKSNYDKGMDTFSAPENMDFAVNTPADELLYIVGPDGKQACFASDRDSKQTMVNVYRVGTTQTRVNITVFKGTYASTFDAKDRKAHIIVEDNLTRERVADVSTDMNGNYLLALPRSGTYKFLVEGGPSGLAHLQNVDVPPNESPKVYRQEIQLVDQGGEKVVIKNYFDEPLEDDVMALAMDEIRRRARLDVTGGKVGERTAEQTVRKDDPLQAAGFDGTMTMKEAKDMAQKEAADLHALAASQENQANAAYNMALKNVAMAEAGAIQARDLVKRAADLEPDEKDRMMRQAAVAKQQSHEANERARVSYRTAREMERARTGTQQRAVASDELATTIASAKLSGNHDQATAALKELKANIDKQKGPERTLDEVERTRRAATGTALEASRMMKQANSQRVEENLLNDRITRLSNEMAAAKGKKKDELGRQFAELKDQGMALHQEVEASFAKAQAAEDEAALARGQAALVKYLAMYPNGTGDSAVPKELIAGVEPRVATVRAEIKALVIDPQYGPVTTLSAEEMERRTFDWAANEPIAGVPRESSGTSVRATSDGSQSPRNIDGEVPKNGKEAQGDTPGAPDQGSTSGQAQDHTANSRPVARSASHTGNRQGTGKSGVENDEASPHAISGESTKDGSVARTTDGRSPASADPLGHVQVVDSAIGPASSDPRSIASASGATNGIINVNGTANSPQGTGPPGLNASAPPDQAPGQSNGIDGEIGTTGVPNAHPDQGESGEPEEQAFLLANKLAELEQLRAGEKDKTARDSLDRAITVQKALIASFQTGSTAAPVFTRPVTAKATLPVDYRPLEYDPSIMDEQLAEEAYPGFALRKRFIMEGPGDPQDKANMIHALEMDLVDSIDVQVARNVALLETEPGKADQVLPALERWRMLKAIHVDNAAKALADVGKEYIASETKAMEDSQMLGNSTARNTAAPGVQSTSPHNDTYISIASVQEVYSSPLVPRSSQDIEAIASKDRDLQLAADMQAEVDSMEQMLEDMPPGKNYDKLRERTDRKIDDLLINQVDLGQRMAFISMSEYAVAKDSAKVLVGILAKRGLPPNEPLVQMAQSYQGSAEASMDRAKGFRKTADRSEDLVMRNSLYQQAYGEELKALRDMDRSHTVRNYLIGAQAVRGESLTYEEIEALMFPAQVAAVSPVEDGGTNGQELSKSAPAISEQVGVVQVGVATGRSPQRTPIAVNSSSMGSKEVADSVLLSDYLNRFYYLEPSERAVIMGGDEERRYFLMKGRSMQERGDAEAAGMEADGSAKLAAALRLEASSMRAVSNSQADPDKVEKANKLETRADALIQRSDSLRGVMDRLLSTATTDDAQAATWMQSMPIDRSTAIMDLEQTKRRTEPVLARTRPVVQSGDALAPQAVTPAPIIAEVRDAMAGNPGTPVADSRNDQRGSKSAVDAASGEAPSPITGPLSQDVFEFASTAEMRKEPIPVDAPMPKGVVYKVQVGAFRNALPAEAFSDMTPVTGEHSGNGLVRYTAGMFTTAENASKASVKVRARGYRDAFVTAYIDGKRVALREAMRQERLATVQAGTVGAVSPLISAVKPFAEIPKGQEAPAPVQLPQGSPELAILSEYPASAEEVLAAFKPSASATDYYNDPTAAPARQVEALQGLFFTVQVGVYSKPTALDKLFNITPLNSERTATGKIRYTTGIFLDEGKAISRKGGTVSLGVTDAFVTAYLNGTRIPVRDARALLAKFGKALLVDPALVTQ